MEEWIEEFLFRGRPPSGPGADEPVTYHVVIGQQADSPLGEGEKVRKAVGPLTPAQSQAAGWPVTRLVEEVNTQALARIDVLTGEVAVLEQARADLTDANGKLTQACDAYAALAEEQRQDAAARELVIASLNAEIERLNAALAAATLAPAEGDAA